MSSYGKIKFSEVQLDLLKQTFPKLRITPDSTIEQIMFAAGREDVIRFVENLSTKPEMMHGGVEYAARELRSGQ